MNEEDTFYDTNAIWTDIDTSSIPGIEIRESTGKLLVEGRDVMQEIDEMRDALLLLKRNVDMESKYPKLRELKDAYQAQLEKYKTFEAMK